MKKLLGVISLCALSGMYIVGCGGSDEESTPTTYSKTITVADGPISGATVIVGNVEYTTDENGNVTVTYSSDQDITVKGGVDIGDPNDPDDDIPFLGILEGSTKYNTVTPLTTLVKNNPNLESTLKDYLDKIPSEIDNTTIKKLNYAVASIIYTFSKGTNINVAKKVIENLAKKLSPENITTDPINALKEAVNKTIEELASQDVNITNSTTIIEAVTNVLTAINTADIANMHSLYEIKDNLESAVTEMESAIPVPKVEINKFNFFDSDGNELGTFNSETNTLTIDNSTLSQNKKLCIVLNVKNFNENVYYPDVKFTLGVTDLDSNRKAVLKLKGVDVNITNSDENGYQINVTLEKGATLEIEGTNSTGEKVSYTLTNNDPTTGLEQYIEIYYYSDLSNINKNQTFICYDLGKLEERIQNDPNAPSSLKFVNYVGNYAISITADNENGTFVPYAAKIIVTE